MATKKRSELHNAARNYAKMGLNIFPLIPKTKRPLYEGSFYGATTDLAQIDEWWSDTPDANIGLATGEVNGLWVLDVDMKRYKDESLIADGEAEILGIMAEAKKDLPMTLVQDTPSGGEQFLYKWNPAHPITGSNSLPRGLDTRGNLGYVVIPSSYIEWELEDAPDKPKTPPKNAHGWYSWRYGGPDLGVIAACPTWFLERINNRPSKLERTMTKFASKANRYPRAKGEQEICDLFRTLQRGERHEGLKAMGAHLFAKNFDCVAAQCLYALNEYFCDDPLALEEVYDLIEWFGTKQREARHG